MVGNIEVTSIELIKPSSPIPRASRDHRLSILDQLSPSNSFCFILSKLLPMLRWSRNIAASKTFFIRDLDKILPFSRKDQWKSFCWLWSCFEDSAESSPSRPSSRRDRDEMFLRYVTGRDITVKGWNGRITPSHPESIWIFIIFTNF